MTENAPKKKPPEAKPKKPPEKNRKGSGFWIGLICFSSVWMFGMGILVGRGTAPVQFDIAKLEKELASLKEAVLKKENARTEKMVGGTDEAPGLEFYDDLKKPKAIEKTAPETGDQVPGAGSKLALLLPTTDVAVLREDEKDLLAQKRSLSANTKKVHPPDLTQIQLPETPEPKPEPAAVKTLPVIPAPAEAPPAETPPPEPEETKQSWTIQVSSLKDRVAADKVVAGLKQKGYQAYSTAANVAGKGVWYRVRVGPFYSRPPADTEMARLKKDNFNAILVSY